MRRRLDDIQRGRARQNMIKNIMIGIEQYVCKNVKIIFGEMNYERF